MDQQPEQPKQPEQVNITYVCADCGQENSLKSGDVFQCKECGYRILYKKRTRESIQFVAL